MMPCQVQTPLCQEQPLWHYPQGTGLAHKLENLVSLDLAPDLIPDGPCYVCGLSNYWFSEILCSGSMGTLVFLCVIFDCTLLNPQYLAAMLALPYFKINLTL